MSVENAERFIRFLKDNKDLQDKVQTAGPEKFEAVTAGAGASCTAYEVACAVARNS
ncbi:MAG: Nif11 family protein [Alphaproteobacteria bacterium]|nr:MAG: Nif11 family protein [Alphaproteobacteria bacterium]